MAVLEDQQQAPAALQKIQARMRMDFPPA